MEATISQLTLVVKNQAEALEFYTSKVGFEKKTDITPPGRDRWVTVGPKSQNLELALWQVGSPDPSGWSKNWRPGNGPPIVLRVDDCRKTFSEMRSRGVEFKQAQPQELPWGISATFSDPDGNLFSINQLPKSPWLTG
ncbi:MAG TPA: VOC family protein [Nitrososphaerales archaeon]|nr:VOC family protein [Nitrososphaerales archaeon]